MTAAAAKLGVVLFLAVVLQAAILSTVEIGGGTPNLVLVVLVTASLLRGSVFGAAAGFAAGFLVDLSTLETLGFTSLLLTIGGYWAGRYGETTGRNRVYAPYLTVAAATVYVALGAYILHFMLSEAKPDGSELLSSLPAQIMLNALLTLPMMKLSRRLYGDAGSLRRTREVEFG